MGNTDSIPCVSSSDNPAKSKPSFKNKQTINKKNSNRES